jgi:hypothetical protein
MANNITSMLGAANYSYLFNNNATQRQNSISSLWKNYGNFQSNAASNLGALTEVRQNAAAVIESFNEARDAFYTEFDDNMAALKESAKNITNVNFNVGENAITKTAETDKDGNEVKDKSGNTVMKTTYNKEMQGALDAIKNLVDSYNDSREFLKDHSAVSGRTGRMASNFGDTTYRASLYESVGINVGSDGALSIDEEKLANSIVNNADKVSRILGSEGLAKKAEQHVNEAESQRDSLFTSDMISKQINQARIYTGKSMLDMMSNANTGNLVNTMF